MFCTLVTSPFITNSFLIAQCVSGPPIPAFTNPSFEGPVGIAIVPSPWNACVGSPDTHPDLTGPLSALSNITPSNGSTYVGFGVNWSGSFVEAVAQTLASPLVAGTNYQFTMDLAQSNTAGVAPPGCVELQIWGGALVCDFSELLWSSGVIMNTNWVTQSINFTPTSAHAVITFILNETCGNGSGYAMIDNIQAITGALPGILTSINAYSSCDYQLLGTGSCPLDSVIVTGNIINSPLTIPLFGDTMLDEIIIFSSGQTGNQTINYTAYFQSGDVVTGSTSITVDNPMSSFQSGSACLGTPVTFTDNSTSSQSSINSWFWDFGDGNMATTQNPTHLFSASGTYSVTLAVTTINGCADTVSQIVEVHPFPIAGFSTTDVCFGETVIYTNNTTISAGNYNSSWDFGDGTSSSLAGPAHLYNTPGTYAATLIVTSDSGCVDTASAVVNVFDSPVSDFNVADDCIGVTALFSDNSTVGGISSITQWEWGFGDGTFASVQNPNHDYTNAGTYDVSLIVTSDKGCTDTMTLSTTRFSLPIADFSPTAVCWLDTTQFTDLSTVTNGTIGTWVWNFSDGSPLNNLQNPGHVYPPGSYDVELIVISNNGCIGSVNKTVEVYPLPIAAFTFDTVCVNAFPTSFTDLSSISSGSTASWDWLFDNGFPTSLQNPSHNFAAAGTFVAQLIVTSDKGCIDTIEHFILVNDIPAVDFIADSFVGCSPVCVNFFDVGSSVNNVITSWQWDFGNGESSVLQHPSACFIPEGIYDIELSVISDKGCENTLVITQMISVWANPQAGFNYTPDEITILNPEVNFSDASLDASSWQWDFGDGNTDVGSDPTHIYTDTGIYIVQQVVFNNYGCSDTISTTVNVSGVFTLYIPNAFTPNEDGANDSFSPKGIGVLAEGYSLYIFDRWGDKIFESHDLNLPWNGSIHDRPNQALQAVYVYKVQLTDLFNRQHEYTGHVTVVR
ncbi:PKD domain-containing protein [Bacteroidales bacterium AH-315-I05]|nr:PKD domain-containing protein [Bacteroidales bacterium AH-315-I05]